MKKSIVPFFALLLVSNFLMAQKPTNYTNSSLFFSAGKSFTGSGDESGLYILSGFSKDYKKWNIAVEVATTLYHGHDALYYSYPSRPTEIYDGSFRYSTYGVQLNLVGSYRIIKSSKNALNFGTGPMLRYQSSSNDGYGISYPAATGYPIPVINFMHHEPQNTFAVGAITRLAYNYRISHKINAGALFSFQLDTNGDTVANTGLSIGYIL